MTNASDNSFQVPDWLKAELFESILKQTMKDFEKIQTFTARPALAAGENYATQMLRIEMQVELTDGSIQSASFMLKIAPDSEFFREIVQHYDIFGIESDMYTKYVPEFEQLFADAGKQIRFGAQTYRFNAEVPHNYVLLQDLRPLGFKNAVRQHGLNMTQTKSVLKKLAQWHAASAVRVERFGAYPPIYQTSYFTEDQRETINSVNVGIYKTYSDCMESYKGQETFLNDVHNLQTVYIEKLYDVVAVDPNEFNVLNHGDCWANNIMFRYDATEDNLLDTYLVDYQIPKWGSPAQDLYYFLLSSTKLELKVKQFEFFIKYYHDNLVKSLKLLKYGKRIPTLKELHISLYGHGFWGYYITVGVMAVVLLDPNENASLDNFAVETEEGNQFRRQIYSNERYQQHAEILLPWLQARGALEA